MATRSRINAGPTSGFNASRDTDPFRRQYIDAPAQAASPQVLATLMEVSGLMTVVPAAMVASQQRELERLKAVHGEDHPRVVELEAQLERAGTLGAMAERAQSRLVRAIEAFQSSEQIFHGFVSDTNFDPLPNLTVRLSSQLSGTTDAEGYFRIPLGSTVVRPPAFLGSVRALGRPRPPKDGAVAAASIDLVEILQGGTVIHTDPVPIPIDDGRVYREYVVARDPAPPRTFRNFVGRTEETPSPKRAARGKARAKTKAKRK